MYTALSSGVAADVVIAVSLVTVLLRSRTGFKRCAPPQHALRVELNHGTRTDSLVNTLMLYTINTGRRVYSSDLPPLIVSGSRTLHDVRASLRVFSLTNFYR